MSSSITETSIAISALTKIGSERISSIDEDSKRARLCKDRISILRNEVLEAHPWKFARKRVELASTGEPDYGWDFSFDLPNDYIQMVIDPEERDTLDDYIIEGRKILANEETAKIIYIFEETNYSRWSHQAAEALAWRLAADIAYAISQSKEVASLMMDGYMKFLKDARYNDSRSQPPRGPVTETFLTSRF